MKHRIDEETLNNVPDFLLQDAADDFVDAIKNVLVRYANSGNLQSSAKRNDVMRAIAKVTKNLKKPAYDLVVSAVREFSNSV